MGLIRTEEDVIRAYGYVADLSKLLVNYFQLWRKHCNGINNITIPEGKFWVQVLRPVSETVLSVRVVYITKVEQSQEYRTPIYDLGASEADGADGVLYYDEGVNTWHEDLLDGLRVNVSVPSLLREDVEAHLIELRRDHTEREREKARLQEIATLEERLSELKR
jgi:hypothetical protein